MYHNCHTALSFLFLFLFLSRSARMHVCTHRSCGPRVLVRGCAPTRRDARAPAAARGAAASTPLQRRPPDPPCRTYLSADCTPVYGKLVAGPIVPRVPLAFFAAWRGRHVMCAVDKCADGYDWALGRASLVAARAGHPGAPALALTLRRCRAALKNGLRAVEPGARRAHAEAVAHKEYALRWAWFVRAGCGGVVCLPVCLCVCVSVCLSVRMCVCVCVFERELCAQPGGRDGSPGPPRSQISIASGAPWGRAALAR